MNAALAPEERAKDLLDKMDLNEKAVRLYNGNPYDPWTISGFKRWYRSFYYHGRK